MHYPCHNKVLHPVFALCLKPDIFELCIRCVVLGRHEGLGRDLSKHQHLKTTFLKMQDPQHLSQVQNAFISLVSLVSVQ